MTIVPFRARALPEGALVINDSGSFFRGSDDFFDRCIEQRLTPSDEEFLAAEGFTAGSDDPLHELAQTHAFAQRLERVEELDYLILVPTLRCNLSCSYCQVSRVNVDRSGFDWSAQTLQAVLELIDRLPTRRIKVEFQGGEPTLRLDLVRAVMERCRRFEDRQFVLCTNLSNLDDDLLDLLRNPHLFISTSLDGGFQTHQRNRTVGASETERFHRNLDRVLQEHGPDKVAALPTIDPLDPPDADELIDSYATRGFSSIYLRPVNYQGFARKRHAHSIVLGDAWRGYYERFVRRLIERNWRDRERVLEESYLSMCLRRIFQPGRDRHVDLRNPNPVGVDYVVIDYDGTVYPTDEARMLSRSGIIDLSIGDIASGWDTAQREALNAHSTNQFDPDCERCVYQPFCGRDLVDDLSRYGRVDLPRLETEFCRRHLHLFDFIFSLVYSEDDAVRYSLTHWLQLPRTPAAFGASHS
jgi:His-Xaa-Ser system radical SAM maturase HxsB